LATHNVVIGGAYPNDWLEVGSTDKNNIQAFLQECLAGEYGKPAAEVKVAVLAIQVTPPGISPDFILVGQTQSINHSNSFASKVLSSCVKAAKNVGNDVVLNYSTDGVSLEVASNREQQKL
jgi:hypothetical protein